MFAFYFICAAFVVQAIAIYFVILQLEQLNTRAH